MVESALPSPAPFDVRAPLPGCGVTVLEASAGTGKTWTIAALTARLVAEGVVRLDQILAVTFTRMATAELRDRIRTRLVETEARLGAYVDHGQAPPPDDQLTGLLAEGPPDEVAPRRARLSDALAGFDEATITTTHGFCQLMLSSLGVAGQGADATLIEDADDTVDEVVDDLYLRGVRHWGQLPFGRRVALDIGRVTVAHPDARLEPAPGQDPAGYQRRLAEGVRTEVARRLLDANLLTYDDLLVRLRETLAAPGRGQAAASLLRERYRVVLVDEFQDTDPVQWEVVKRAFGDGTTTLVLIGDPKQAIYSFRGADVFAYLDAARSATARLTLGENWRSDAGLLEAYDALFDPLRLGHAEIPYRTVTAAPAHRHPGLVGAPVDAPLRVRVLHASDGLARRTPKGLVQKDAAVEWVAGDLAADVVRLLSSGARIVERDEDIEAGDVAVLVRTNRQAGIVHAALRAAGVPAVIGGTESVFGSPAARHWLRLLEALEQPSRRPQAAAVALTPFVGLTAGQVAGAGEQQWEELQSKLYRWAEILRRRGVAALRRHVFSAEGLPGRVLGEASGERELTDLAHIAQLLHAEGTAGQLGPPALRAWLANRIDEAADDTGAEADERSRRLDSDAEAVQVLTVHRAKGLEFPVLYCPFLWDASNPPRSGRPVVYHDASPDHRRTLDVGVAAADSPAYLDHLALARREQRDEDLRLMYVALTRACHQAVIWWVKAYECQHSPLARMLMFRQPDGTVPDTGKYVPRDGDVQARFEELAARVPGRINVERCGRYEPAKWAGRLRSLTDLDLASFDRTLDLQWRRTSYTGITAASHDEAVGSEPEDPGITDEPSGPGLGDGEAGPQAAWSSTGASTTEDEAPLRAVLSPMAEVETGAEVGTFVHAVLERIDFAAGDLTAEVAAAIEAERSRRPLPLGPEGALAAGLVAALSTPLGPVAGGQALRHLGRADRLDELGFELPLAGGDQPSGEVLLPDVARIFAAHTHPGDPLQDYPGRLASPVLASHLRGYLTGSLDLVARFPGADGTPRFVVLDYKTNWLAPEGEALSAWHYRPAALDAEMQRAHYPLQAVLYLVALHRYLRWRLPGYDPAVHLGGALYLFLRGMTGPDAPTVAGSTSGVFAWSPPSALVTELSDLLDGGVRR
jgi:exodeoxyribonuclease V beta subunit